MNNLIDEVLTAPEATEIWGLGSTTLKNILNQSNGTNLKRAFIEGVDYRKSGKTWLVTRAAMVRVYGIPTSKIAKVYKEKEKNK